MNMPPSNIFKGATVFVTGATGLIGSNLVSRLLALGDVRVIAIGRSGEKLSRVFSAFPADRRPVLVEHDMARPLPDRLGHVDFFFHAAGTVSGKSVRTSPLSVISANMFGMFNALDRIVQQGGEGRMVVFSSATVYGIPESEGCVVEDWTTSAESLDSEMAPYSESKRMAEVVARAYARQRGVDVRIARFGYVYGPCPVPQDNAFYDFVRLAREGRDLVFRSSGFPRRDNIYVDDAVDGLLCVCARGAVGEAYNISSGGALGNYAAIDEIAMRIADAANAGGRRSVKVAVQAAVARAPGIVLDNAKLRALGWDVATSLEDGVRKTFECPPEDWHAREVSR